MGDGFDQCLGGGVVDLDNVTGLQHDEFHIALARFGIIDLVGPQRIFHSVDAAIRALHSGPPENQESTS
ncbi:MAG: hypothetical protein E5W75_22340 [Mesorhizobium sp.]|nr:MAG: hypothetical protein E5W75_22340 [Mesorhizobium sp.]